MPPLTRLLFHHQLRSIARSHHRPQCQISNMAKSKYEYVKEFELEDKLLPGTWIVIRIDGQSFHKFTTDHEFHKPNDENGILLMNKAATKVMEAMSQICVAYGQSDEYSFVFKPSTDSMFNRRSSKLISTVVSLFTAYYQFLWGEFMLSKKLLYPPTFDGRAILYPNSHHLRDYLNWRQVDCHINNLYNTCFWSLVKAGSTHQEAEKMLRVTSSAQKNELLFSKFSMNYNNIPEMYRKGSILFQQGKKTICLNTDIIKDDFWDAYPFILNIQK